MQQQFSASTTVGFSMAQSPPWVYPTLAELWDIEQNGRLVEGFGDFMVLANTAIRVRKLLSQVRDVHNLPAAAVSVFSGGGITLTWEIGPREVKYTFWPEGVLTYYKEDDGKTIGEEELPTDSGFNPKEPLRWLLQL